jgi:PAS domain-containing protein
MKNSTTCSDVRQQPQSELKTIIDHTPFLLTYCSSDLRYRFASAAYAKMIARRPEDVAGRSIIEVMGEDGFKTILPYIEAVTCVINVPIAEICANDDHNQPNCVA